MPGSFLDSPLYRQMMAQTLLKTDHGPQPPGAAIANALGDALRFYTVKQYGQQQQADETAKKADETAKTGADAADYARALSNFSGPRDNSTWDASGDVSVSGGGLAPIQQDATTNPKQLTGMTNDPKLAATGALSSVTTSGSGLGYQGQPGQVAISPRVSAIPHNMAGPEGPAEMAQRLAATGNPELQKQAAPSLMAQLLAPSKTTLSPEDAAAAGLQAGGVYQRGQNNDISTVQAPPRLDFAQPGSVPVNPYTGIAPEGAKPVGGGGHYRAATPDEIASRGYPKGTTAQIDTTTNEFKQGFVPPQMPPGTIEAGWSVMQDPSNGKQFRYNARTGEARGLDNQPYAPGAAGKLQSGVPRSPATAAFLKWQQENPNATAAEFQQAAGRISQTVAGGRAMGSGPDGAGVLAANAVAQHLQVYEELASAMKNGDVQAINAAKNRFQQAFGVAAPTNAAFANKIVGPELVKAIIAGGGTGAERDAMEQALTVTNNSWEQASGLASTAKRLIGGQLSARQKKFTFNGLGKPEDFRQALEPEAQAILDQFGGSAAAPVTRIPGAGAAGPAGNPDPLGIR